MSVVRVLADPRCPLIFRERILLGCAFSEGHLLFGCARACLVRTSSATHVFPAVLFEASSVHRIFYQPDAHGNLKSLKPISAKLPELAVELALVARLPKSNRG